MCSMNTATPAACAPGVSVAGMMISESWSTGRTGADRTGPAAGACGRTPLQRRALIRGEARQAGTATASSRAVHACSSVTISTPVRPNVLSAAINRIYCNNDHVGFRQPIAIPILRPIPIQRFGIPGAGGSAHAHAPLHTSSRSHSRRAVAACSSTEDITQPTAPTAEELRRRCALSRSTNAALAAEVRTLTAGRGITPLDESAPGSAAPWSGLAAPSPSTRC